MKKFDAKFIKYSVVLFIVSVALISVGTISLTRSVERTDKSNSSAKTRIEVLSNENVELKQQVAALSETAEKYSALNSVFEAEIMIKNGDYENALICLEKIDKKYLKGTFASAKYEELLEMIKENTKND